MHQPGSCTIDKPSHWIPALAIAFLCAIVFGLAGCGGGGAGPGGGGGSQPTPPPPEIPIVPSDDHGDSRADATALAIGDSVSGEIERNSDDEDYFRVEVTASGTLTLYTTGALNSSGELQTGDGSVLAADHDSGADDHFRIAHRVGPGSYYVKVSGHRYVDSAGVTYKFTGPYAVHALFVAHSERDHGDSPSDATVLALGDSVSGAIETLGDKDFFRVEVTEPGTLTVYTTGDLDTAGELRTDTQVLLARDDNRKANFNIKHDVGPGTYSVRVNASYRVTSPGEAIGNYVLHVRFVPGRGPPPDDHGSTRADATELPLGSSVRGFVIPGDTDYFRVEVTQPGTLTFYTSSGSGDVLGQLQAADGTSLGFVGRLHSAYPRTVIRHPVTTGTYYIRISTWVPPGTEELDAAGYGLHAALDVHGSTRADATELALGGSVRGEIGSPRDDDLFRMQVTEAGVLTVYTTGGISTYGILQAGDGAFLAEDAGWGSESLGTADNFQIAYKVMPGTYYIEVSAGGGDLGSYIVHARFVAGTVDDDHGESRADATVLPLGSSLPGTLETFNDNDFFRVEVAAPGVLTVYTTGAQSHGKLQADDGASLGSERGTNIRGREAFVYDVNPGTYYIRVSSILSVDGSHLESGDYVVHTQFVVDPSALPPDQSDTPAGASAVTFGETVRGSIESPGDVDYFRYTIAEPGLVDITFTAAPGTEIAALDEMGNVLASGVVGHSASTRRPGPGNLGTLNLETLNVGVLVLQIGGLVGTQVLIRVTSQQVLTAAAYSIVGVLTTVVPSKLLNLRVQQGALEWQDNLDEYHECVRNGQRLNRDCKLSYEVSAVTKLTAGSTELLSHTLTQDNSLRFNPPCTQPLGEYKGKVVVKLLGFTIRTVSVNVEVFDDDEKLCAPGKIKGSPSLSVSVPQGGNVAIDLSDYIEDPREGQLTLTSGGFPPGITVSLNGSIWTIAASGDAEAGEHQLPITATSIKGSVEKSSDFTLQVIVEGELGPEWIRARNVDCHARRTSLSRLRLLRDDQPAPYTYSGGCSQRMVHGQGTATLADAAVGDARYSGEWRDGHASGQGTLTLPSGNRYVGEFLNGLRHGQGRWTNVVDGFNYEGGWSDGLLSGQGTATWADGARYVGEWREGRQNGQGTWTHPNGDRLDGEWLNGGFSNVRGTWTRPSDGTRFQGTWRFGQFCDGWETAPDGSQAFYRDCQVVVRR